MSDPTLVKGKRIYKPLFLFCRQVWRVFHKKQPVYGMESVGDLPAIFIGRHQNLYGPVEIIAWTPIEFKVWTLYKFMTTKDCYRHYAESFYPGKGFGPVNSKIRAAIAAPFVAAFMRSMNGISVYRGQKNILDTFRMSVDALKQGQSLLIMPERDYRDSSNDAGELYTGFVHLAQMYYRATGKPLSFYPVYPSRENESIYVEKPIVFDPTKPFRAERDRVVEQLKRERSHRAVESQFNIRVADSGGSAAE